MSIDWYFHLDEKAINEKFLLTQINKLNGDLHLDVNTVAINNILQIDSTYELVGFTVFFSKTLKSPSEGWDTIFSKEKFEYSQVIVFEFNKWGDIMKEYANAMKLIFYIMNELNTNAYLNSCVHNDICYFENNKNVYINSETPFVKQIERLAKKSGKWKCLYRRS